MNEISKKENDFLISLGKRLEIMRKEKGFTQGQLAEGINTKHSQIGRIERGESNSTIIVLQRIAKALDVPLTDLISLD